MRAQCLEWIRWQNWVQQLFAALHYCQRWAITRACMYLWTTLFSAPSLFWSGLGWPESWAGRPILQWVFWPLFTVGRFTEHERSFNTLLHTLPVIEIHTREHPTTHTDQQSDTQQLHSGSKGLRCLAKRHFDGSSSRAQYQLLKADFWGGGFEQLNL